MCSCAQGTLLPIGPERFFPRAYAAISLFGKEGRRKKKE
jgi:hypothetical protein